MNALSLIALGSVVACCITACTAKDHDFSSCLEGRWELAVDEDAPLGTKLASSHLVFAFESNTLRITTTDEHLLREIGFEIARSSGLEGRIALESGEVVSIAFDHACTTMSGVDDAGSRSTLTRASG